MLHKNKGSFNQLKLGHLRQIRGSSSYHKSLSLFLSFILGTGVIYHIVYTRVLCKQCSNTTSATNVPTSIQPIFIPASIVCSDLWTNFRLQCLWPTCYFPPIFLYIPTYERGHSGSVPLLPSFSMILSRAFHIAAIQWFRVISHDFMWGDNLIVLICISLMIWNAGHFFQMPNGHLYIFFFWGEGRKKWGKGSLALYVFFKGVCVHIFSLFVIGFP